MAFLRRYWLVCVFFLIGFGLWLRVPKLVVLEGETMGTTYSIRAFVPKYLSSGSLQLGVDEVLDRINAQLSTWDEGSEISRFNRAAVGESIAISEDFVRVLKLSQQVYRLTEGAWDGTVKPLVDLWGFSGSMESFVVPDSSEIAEVLGAVGFDRLGWESGHTLVKFVDGLLLDFSSIAKGDAVDEVVRYLRGRGVSRFFVEIGGEVYAGGRKPNGERWRVGINTPRPGSDFESIFEVIELENQAVATSGDYRNFYEIDGVLYSHILDPRTGAPVPREVASVSVVAPTCAMADGLATGLMVMGQARGLALVNRLDDVEVLFVVYPDFSYRKSSGFNPL